VHDMYIRNGDDNRDRGIWCEVLPKARGGLGDVTGVRGNVRFEASSLWRVIAVRL